MGVKVTPCDLPWELSFSSSSSEPWSPPQISKFELAVLSVGTATLISNSINLQNEGTFDCS